MKALFTIITLLLCFQSSGQQAFIDSCKQLLNSSIHDTTRAIIYIDLAEEVIDEKTWTYYNRKALNFSNKKIADAKGKSKRLFQKVRANATGNIGYYYDDHGDKSKALKYYFKSLKQYDEAKSPGGKAVILGNIGVIFTNQGDYDEALDYLNQSIKLKKKYSPESVAKNYLNLGVVYQKKGDSAKSLVYFEKSLVVGSKMNDHQDMAVAQNNIGAFFFGKRDFNKAIGYFRKSIVNYDQMGDEAGVAWVMANMGACFYNVDQVDSALHYELKAWDIAQHYNYPELTLTISEKLTDSYVYLGEWEKAFSNLRISVKMEDSLRNVGTQKAALRQKLEFDHNLQTAGIEAERKQERELASQRFMFILIGMILAVVFGIVIYSRLRVTRRQKITIEAQKKEVESQSDEIQEKNKEIVDSINYAKRLQKAILPTKSSILKPFNDAFLYYKPKDIVAGDFFWMHEINQDEYLIAAADCTGHGVPGAMVSVVCANALDRATKEFGLSDTGKILDKVAHLVIERLDHGAEDVKDGMDIALCKVNTKHGTVAYSGAHNPLWIIKNGSDEVEVIRADRQPIGKFDGLQPFQQSELTLAPGDWIYIFSDGYADQFGGEKGKKYKSANLKRLLLSNVNKTGEEQELALDDQFFKWKGDAEQIDDVCVIGVKI